LIRKVILCLTKHRAVKTIVKWRCSSTHS
jgi:hypothetical protein